MDSTSLLLARVLFIAINKKIYSIHTQSLSHSLPLLGLTLSSPSLPDLSLSLSRTDPYGFVVVDLLGGASGLMVVQTGGASLSF